jgi:uncharacterized damage-inducible protein DinB
MQKRLTELLEYLDSRRTRLLAEVADVTADVAEMRPREGTWSAAQILTHLAIVEAGVARLIEKSVKWARENGIGPESSDESVLASLDARKVATSRESIEAPEALEPPADAKIATAVESLSSSRMALRRALEAGDGLDLAVVKRQHRILGELNIYEWGLFIAQHEERHTRQIRETIEAVCAEAARTTPVV